MHNQETQYGKRPTLELALDKLTLTESQKSQSPVKLLMELLDSSPSKVLEEIYHEGKPLGENAKVVAIIFPCNANQGKVIIQL